jgi:hypothetical protein
VGKEASLREKLLGTVIDAANTDLHGNEVYSTPAGHSNAEHGTESMFEMSPLSLWERGRG